VFYPSLSVMKIKNVQLYFTCPAPHVAVTPLSYHQLLRIFLPAETGVLSVLGTKSVVHAIKNYLSFLRLKINLLFTNDEMEVMSFENRLLVDNNGRLLIETRSLLG